MTPCEETVDVAILVVNWNTGELLTQALESLARCSHLSLRAIVVDNASADGSADLVRSRFPAVELLAFTENAGFVRGNNAAYQVAGDARYVLLLNPDAILQPCALEIMVAFLDTHPLAGACGPLTLNPDGTLQPSWSRFPSVRSELWSGHDRRFFGQTHLPDLSLAALRALSSSPRVDWVSGACLLVRRSALENDLGGVLLDTAFQMYSEETDLCLRLAQVGWTTHLVTRAEAIHFYGQSSKQAPARTLRLLYRSKYLFFRKHYGWGRTTLLKLSVAMTYGAKWAAYALLHRVEQRDRQRAILQSLGPDARP